MHAACRRLDPDSACESIAIDLDSKLRARARARAIDR